MVGRIKVLGAKRKLKKSKMKRLQYFFMASIALFFIMLSCQDQNDLHNVWLVDGEDNYVGRVDSLTAFGGDERIEFQVYLSDPRVKFLNISWNEFGAERETRVAVPVHEKDEPFTVAVGVNEDIQENEYTFTFVSDDDGGVQSIPFQAIGRVYGPRYQETLSNRLITGFEITDEGIFLDFSSALNADDQGVELMYNNGAENLDLTFSPEDLEDRVFLETPNFSTPISYSTVYQPLNSIDTFSAETVIPSIEKLDNIALGKPATSTPTLNGDQFAPRFAVDGVNFDNSSRWINHRVAGTHWIEIDFEGTFPVEVVRIYDDTPIADFMLEVEVGGVWQELESITGNTNKFIERTYSNPINAEKIRYSFETFDSDPSVIVRMFEFEVFSTVKVQ